MTIPASTPDFRDQAMRRCEQRTRADAVAHRRRCGNTEAQVAAVDAEHAEAGVWAEIASLARTQAWRATAMFTAPWAAEDLSKRIKALLEEALTAQDDRIAARSLLVLEEARRR